MKIYVICLFLVFNMIVQSYAQSDTMVGTMDPVFITAHRDGRKLSSLSTSALLIPQEQIKIMGAVRLQQVLSEQSGILIVPQVNGLGSGIQLQGFNPDYTLILVDGEPLVGRNTGLLDLNRISLNPIKQIEIVKGPSSSLYGSEALAGVVNIITQRTEQNQLKANLRFSSNTTSDMNLSAGLTNRHTDALIQVSRYSTNGYDLSPLSYGQTISPHQQWSTFAKINTSLGKHELSLGTRFFNEDQQSQYLVNEIATRGVGRIQDWMVNPVWKFKITPNIHSTLRAYYTRYAATAIYRKDQSGEEISSDDFHQSFARLEWNPKVLINQYHSIIGGLGYIKEEVRTIRYGSNEPRFQYTKFAFTQYSWRPRENREVNAGVRYDHNNVYGGQVSPKLSFIAPIFKSIYWNGSIGLGFKSPDFRQLYLDFTNAAGGGYSVLGREVLETKLNVLESQGQIAGYLKNITEEKAIKPERSVSFNTAIKSNMGKIHWELGFFYSRVAQLIETEPVAQLRSGSNIFSYFNINKVRIQGLDAQWNYKFNPQFKIQSSYQLLYAHDLRQLDLLQEGTKFRRDPVTLSSVRLHRNDYFGLSNRSRHTAQIKLFYQPEDLPINGSIRAIYRSRFGMGSNSGTVQGGEIFVSEQSGNDILDRYDHFVKGYTIMNLTIGWSGFKTFDIQCGLENVFNKTIPSALPGLAGRILYLNLNYSLSKKSSN